MIGEVYKRYNFEQREYYLRSTFEVGSDDRVHTKTINLTSGEADYTFKINNGSSGLCEIEGNVFTDEFTIVTKTGNVTDNECNSSKITDTFDFLKMIYENAGLDINNLD